jgi:hypothetical protein
MDYSVSIRKSSNKSFNLSFIQVNKDLRYDCFQYLNMDKIGTLNDTLQLNCNPSNTINKTIYGITIKKNFNALLSIGLRERRISSHHARFIDYQHCI